MKKYLLLFGIFAFATASFAQTSGPNDPASAAQAPPPQCLSCPGSIWSNETNVYLQDNTVADVWLEPNANCFQSTCYRSRYIYASNFGFNIPGTATITGIVAEIFCRSGNANGAADSTVKLVQSTVPVGANRASVTAWPISGAYSLHGSSSDLWGFTWAPADINDPGFGLYLKVYNMDPNATVNATVDHIRITIYFSTTTGTFSQTSSSSSLNAYQNENELNVVFISNEPLAKASLKIFSMLGEMQMKKELTNVPSGSNNEKFELKDLAPGIYFVQMDNGKSIQTKKIFIK